MQEKFVKESNIIEKSFEEKQKELYQCVENSKKNLQKIYNNMQFAESDLIDYYTYQIKAEEAKFNYLIKQVKKLKEPHR